MPEKKPDSPAVERALDELFAEYLEAAENGHPMELEQLIAAHPELTQAATAHEGFDERVMAQVVGALTAELAQP